MFLAAITTPDHNDGYSFCRTIHMSAKFDNKADALAWCQEYINKLSYLDIVKHYKFAMGEGEYLDKWLKRNPKPVFEMREPKLPVLSELKYQPSAEGWKNIIAGYERRYSEYQPLKQEYDENLATWTEAYNDRVDRARKLHGPKWKNDNEKALLNAIPYQNRNVVYFELP